MAQEFDVFTRHELTEALENITRRTIEIESRTGKFPKLKILVKNYRKPKSSAQHSAYWRCIGELKKAFLAQGMTHNEEEIHQYVKAKAGFTKVIDGVTVTRSISDLSPDATSEWLNHLIDFVVRFAQENLDYSIEIN